MRLYFEPKTKHLMIVPLRNGTIIFDDVMQRHGIVDVTGYLPTNYYQHPDIPYDITSLLDVINSSNRRTLMFKEPFERLVSFYRNFIYNAVFLENHINLNERFELFSPKNRKLDYWSDMFEAKDLFEKYYKCDPHTMPQYSFFDITKQNIDDYDIVDSIEIQKWMQTNFSEEIETRISPIYEIPIKFSSIDKIKVLQDMCKVLYKDDYEYLEPKIRYL